MRNRLLCILLCFVFVMLAGCSNDQQDIKTKKRPAVESEELQFQTPAEGAPIAIFSTPYGEFRAVLYPDLAPMAVENFIALANEGYFNGLPFHRVISDFIIQSGDGTGSGNGGTTCWDGIPFPVELSSKLHHYSGALAMAHLGQDTTANFSQFYIVQTPADSISEEDATSLKEKGMKEQVANTYQSAGGAPYLDNKNTIFGQVYQGMDVVDKIAIASASNDEGTPSTPVSITSVLISSYGQPDPTPLPSVSPESSSSESSSNG